MEIKPETDFEERVFRKSKSPMTLRFYRSGKKKLDQFIQYRFRSELEHLASEIKNGTLDVYKVLDDYAGWLIAQNLKPKTVRDYVVASKKILRFHDIRIINEEFCDKVTLPTIEEIMDEAPSAEQIRVIVSRCKPKLKALILLMATSGMREGEALMLRVKDIDFQSKPARIVIPASITKTSRGRETYITDEAVAAVKSWFEYWDAREGRRDEEALENGVEREVRPRTPESRLLDCGDNIYSAEKNVIKMFRAVMEHFPEMNLLVDENHRVHKIHLYSFRKFFFSKVMPVIGEERAHALMGHGSYMKTYNKRTPEERRADYLKCADVLSVMKPSEAVTREEVDKLTTLKGIETALRAMPVKGFPLENQYEDYKKRRGLTRELTIDEKIEIADKELESVSNHMQMMLGVGEDNLGSDYGSEKVIEEGLDRLKVMVNRKERQLIVTEAELPRYIETGWSAMMVLPSGKIVIKK